MNNCKSENNMDMNNYLILIKGSLPRNIRKKEF